MALRSGITISFTALTSRYRGIRVGAMTRELTKHAKDTANDIVKKVRTYPPPRAGSFKEGRKSKLRGGAQFGGEYVRTRDLYRAWEVINTSGGGRISYEIQNLVRDRRRGRYYARLVHGGPAGTGQWWYHADTGWKRIDEAVLDIGGRQVFREIAQDIISDHAK